VMGRNLKAPADKKCVLTGERFRLERVSEEVYRRTQSLGLLPPAAMTNERKMENTNAPRKT
jgi:hypothetical protein